MSQAATPSTSSPHPHPSPDLPAEKSRPYNGFQSQNAVLVGKAKHGHQSEEPRLGEAGCEWFQAGGHPSQMPGLHLRPAQRNQKVSDQGLSPLPIQDGSEAEARGDVEPESQ